MDRCYLCCLLLKCVLLCVGVNSYSVSNQHTFKIRPSSKLKYINFPNSNEGAVIYMRIFGGIYPDIQDASFVGIGQPVSIVIFLVDNSGSYDVGVDECWAHDDANLEFSDRKLSLTKKQSKSKKKIVSDWKKLKSLAEHKTLLYTNFTSFRFPEKEQIFFTCSVKSSKSSHKSLEGLRFLYEDQVDLLGEVKQPWLLNYAGGLFATQSPYSIRASVGLGGLLALTVFVSAASWKASDKKSPSRDVDAVPAPEYMVTHPIQSIRGEDKIDRSLGSEIRYLWEPHYRLPNTELKYGSHIVKYKR